MVRYVMCAFFCNMCTPSGITTFDAFFGIYFQGENCFEQMVNL